MKLAHPPQIAVVVTWPHSVPAPVVRQAMRRLIERGAKATWAVDQLSQVETLASWGVLRAGGDAALRLESSLEGLGERSAGELARRLDLMRGTGLAIDVVLGPSAMTRDHWPRTLRSLGIHGLVVAEPGETAAARAMPFGVWQFAPRVIAPRKRTWKSWFCRKRMEVVPGNGGVLIVVIDLNQIGAPSSRPWSEVDAMIENAMSGASRADTQLATIGGLAAQLIKNHSPRPQRSILRTAA